MKLAVYSDLHLEFAPFEPPALDVDVVVLAGDIAPKLNGLRFAEHLAERWPVLYVLGNHEHYGSHTQLASKLKARASSRVHVLENDQALVQGVRFLGCTLWSDFELAGNPGASRAEALRTMSDYDAIRSAEFGFEVLKPVHTYRKHLESRAWLRKALREPFQGTTVVVTHHAPSGASLDPQERASPLSGAYASALDELVESSGAALWIHGHTHRSVDYRIGNTRVLSNQRGYPAEPASGFQPALVVSLG